MSLILSWPQARNAKRKLWFGLFLLLSKQACCPEAMCERVAETRIYSLLVNSFGAALLSFYDGNGLYLFSSFSPSPK